MSVIQALYCTLDAGVIWSVDFCPFIQWFSKYTMQTFVLTVRFIVSMHCHVINNKGLLIN